MSVNLEPDEETISHCRPAACVIYEWGYPGYHSDQIQMFVTGIDTIQLYIIQRPWLDFQLKGQLVKRITWFQIFNSEAGIIILFCTILCFFSGPKGKTEIYIFLGKVSFDQTRFPPRSNVPTIEIVSSSSYNKNFS